MRILLPAVLVSLGVLVGCGGGDAPPTAKPTTESRASTLSHGDYEARVESVCRQAVAETKQLGREFSTAGRRFSNAGGLVLTTEGLVKPGMRIRERMAARIRALGPPPNPEEALRAYLELFDPIEVLIEERLRAGQAGDSAAATKFEQLGQHLGNEQRNDARLAGLRACAVDFVQVAFSATSGG